MDLSKKKSKNNIKYEKWKWQNEKVQKMCNSKCTGD